MNYKILNTKHVITPAKCPGQEYRDIAQTISIALSFHTMRKSNECQNVQRKAETDMREDCATV